MQPAVFVTLGVRNMEESVRFWLNTVGLESSGVWPGQHALRRGSFELLLDATGEFPPQSALEIGLCVSPAELTAILQRHGAAGNKVLRGPKDFGGPLGCEAAIQSPDGPRVTLFCPRN